ncbi:hypothetical protein GOTRE_175_00160 [Gordonia terrae NBRC 100016]|uniref:Uncharacterized protein n=1 Tax=Gordonia terrae NBRC 100016 TaxID=1089454 RepID=A0ABQ0HKY1_9ACTN|nr:hypothetical protein GOTRE_175_00160 [Gordonia terrae NBRC 100016]
MTDQVRCDEPDTGEVVGQRCPATAVAGEPVDGENRRTAAEDMGVESCHPSILPYGPRRKPMQVADGNRRRWRRLAESVGGP